jgi:hypothetical protein
MKLTRRDALIGCAAGVAGGSVLAAATGERASAPEPTVDGALEAGEVATLLRLAEVVYPDEVTASVGFLEGYVGTRAPSHVEAIRRAIRDLDGAARSRYGSRFGELSAGRRETVLWDLGVDTVTPAPTGTVPARVRYHLVNGLLYALFTSPRGSRLFGFENPIGYPGGYYGADRVGGDE